VEAAQLDELLEQQDAEPQIGESPRNWPTTVPPVVNACRWPAL
jgi:hypothetical protein